MIRQVQRISTTEASNARKRRVFERVSPDSSALIVSLSTLSPPQTVYRFEENKSHLAASSTIYPRSLSAL